MNGSASSPLGFDEIASVMGGRWVQAPTRRSFDFTGVSIDTRELTGSQVFFAFVGERTDGHEHLAGAARAGASMCVVTRADRVPPELSVPVLLVGDALEAVTALARFWRRRLTARVVAVTGSNGKTTTCRLIASICARAGAARGSPRSFNNALGVPITILNTPMGADFLVAELGTSSPGEIAARAGLVRPDIAVITSIGRAHLQELGDRAGVAREKASIIAALADGSPAIIPFGVPELEAAIDGLGAEPRLIRIGADGCPSIVEAGPSHTRLTISGVEFSVPLLGAHNASNGAMAVAAGRELGIDDELIRAGLLAASPPPMRFARTEIATGAGPITLFNDAYNANPDSVRAALSTFNAIEAGVPRIAVLGDMLELGAASAPEHAAVVAGLAGWGSIDLFILVGEAFAAAAKPDAPRVRVFPECDELTMARIADSIPPGSLALLKASRGIRLERVAAALESRHAQQPRSVNTNA